MALVLSELRKNYQGREIIPAWNHRFEPHARVAILGGNGSGKSTFLKLLSGQLSPSQGTMTCPEISANDWAITVSYTGPHVDFQDAFTPRELFAQHQEWRPLRPEASLEAIPLPVEALDRPLRDFSSGMKQRIKLALAIWTDAPILLLDEPCSHLDQAGMEWYQQCLQGSLAPTERFSHRMVFVASNHKPEEISQCTEAFLPTGASVVPLPFH
jgi:ABC-type multidrug transport system ATPase subunit